MNEAVFNLERLDNRLARLPQFDEEIAIKMIRQTPQGFSCFVAGNPVAR
jgi:hypothetical protein